MKYIYFPKTKIEKFILLGFSILMMQYYYRQEQGSVVGVFVDLFLLALPVWAILSLLKITFVVIKKLVYRKN